MSEFIMGFAEGLATIAICYAMAWLVEWCIRRGLDRL